MRNKEWQHRCVSVLCICGTFDLQCILPSLWLISPTSVVRVSMYSCVAHAGLTPPLLPRSIGMPCIPHRARHSPLPSISFRSVISPAETCNPRPSFRNPWHWPSALRPWLSTSMAENGACNGPIPDLSVRLGVGGSDFPAWRDLGERASSAGFPRSGSLTLYPNRGPRVLTCCREMTWRRA